MEFSKFVNFLHVSLNLPTIETLSIREGGFTYVIGEKEVLNYIELKEEVIDELNKNLSSLREHSIPIYFNELYKKIEEYYNIKTNSNWSKYPNFGNNSGSNIQDEFYYLLKEIPENEIILDISKTKGGILNYYSRINNVKRKNIINDLKLEIEKIEEQFFKKDHSNKSFKLIWKGQKNQLYNVLRQLKNLDLIGNSYNNLADFLIENVSGFENTSKGTIEKEINKIKDLPKPKRINIEPDRVD